MKVYIILFFSGLGQMAFSQGEENKFQGGEKQPLFSYTGFKTISIDPFDYHLLSGTPQATGSVIKPLPALNHLPGMFCKIEYKLEAKSKLAPRFRLGSLNYTDWMEGKKGFEVRYWK